MQSLEFVAAALGGGATSEVIGWLRGRRRGRIDEAQIIANISAQLRQELFQKYEERGQTISKLRRIIIFLTNMLESYIPRITGLARDEMETLRDAVLEARLAGLAAEI